MSKPVCVVVGAGPGLGMNIARRFAQGGFDIALISRKKQNLDAMSKVLFAEGYSARGFTADAGNEDELQSAFAEISAWNNDVEVLIYNAAIMKADSAVEMTASSMMDAMSVNLYGAITSVNQILPAMRLNSKGTILITGGGLAIEPYPNWTALGAGKAALRSYALSLHKTLTPDNIHVAVIAVCGIVEAGGLFDPDLIAEHYWQLHIEERPNWRRELVYLPEGADPFYNDGVAKYRTTSKPIFGNFGSEAVEC